MNALEQRNAIDNLIDRVKSARFADNRYYQAINEAQQVILDGRSESVKVPKQYSFQSSQRLRDTLYTLIAPTVSGAPISNDTIDMPDDYYYLTLMQATITDNFSGAVETNAIRAITYGEQGIFKRNPFKKPKLEKSYFDERNGNWKIFIPDNSTLTSYSLDYLKRPVRVSIGNEGDKITAGGTLVLNAKYYVYDECIVGGITYYDGVMFVANGTTLTSGTVIPFNNVVNCEFPIELHDEINRLAAAIMMNSLDNYLKETMLKKQNNEY